MTGPTRTPGSGLGLVGLAERAAALHLSVPTVKGHVPRLLEKLETTNRVQIALCVRDAGHPVD